MSRHPAPLLTLSVHEAITRARRDGQSGVDCSLDLGRSVEHVDVEAEHWRWQGRSFPFLENAKDRTVYYWTGTAFEPAARFTNALIKLIPTEWGPPTFEIDGIKMLPTAKVSPYADAERKVGLIQPRGKAILDTCGGLGYFAAWCLAGHAARIDSYEKNPDVIWLRSLNPWSPENTSSADGDDALHLTCGDVVERISTILTGSVDAILHDPPRFGIAGDLYSQQFYDELARVLGRRGRLFHYTGSPNKVTSGRNVPREVSMRLQRAGFTTEFNGDGVLAIKGTRR